MIVASDGTGETGRWLSSVYKEMYKGESKVNQPTLEWSQMLNKLWFGI